jgi:transcriptional regulator
MYRPPAFALGDDAALAVVVRSPLSQLVVVADGAPLATPVPMIVRGEALVGHLARPNPVLKHPGPAVAIFTDADAYVTPRWYPGKAIDGKVVPTWNYTTVQISGRLIVHDDPGWTRQVVTDLTDHFESASAESTNAEPWSVSDAPDEWIAGMLRAIVGIELVQLQIVGKHKLSQNRPVDDRIAVADGLDALGDPAGSATRSVADAIRRTL